jgi:NADH:ubiquinone oxidoreductase subunit 6 (subunit J)
MMPLHPLACACLAAGFNWHGFFFLLFAAVACGLALAVVLTDNVVRMAFHLVLSLGATAGLFFLAGAEFVGAMQLMIYVGGTLVLLVFGVMLTAQAPFVSIATPPGEKMLGAVVGLALFAILLRAGFSQPEWSEPASISFADRQPSATPIGMALVGVRVDASSGSGDGSAAGKGSPARPIHRLPGYLLPFEIVSVHLLVVLVGAAYLARAKRRRTPRVIEGGADEGVGPAEGRPNRDQRLAATAGGGRG